MSVMCSVYVPEGIVLATDSRMTVGLKNAKDDQAPNTLFSISDNAQKIVLLSKVRVGITACGAGILGEKAVADFLRVFEIEEVTPYDTVSDVTKKLQQYALRYFPQVHFFAAGYDGDEPFMYDVNRESKRWNIKDGKIRYAASWSGEQQAITKLMNADPQMLINFNIMPLKDAIDFAEFLIDLTIKYQRFESRLKTCGGDIDILVLTKDDAFWYRHKIYKRA
ncbi:MAG: hypothetical protein RRY79_01120 [Clostridia bacterium]